jgi:hypothetical protein
LLDTGLINRQGRDTFCRRVIFPCRQHGHIVNLYGRGVPARLAGPAPPSPTACCRAPKAACSPGSRSAAATP